MRIQHARVRLQMRAKIFQNVSPFCDFFNFPPSLSPFMPCILFSRRGFSRPTPRRLVHLPSPGRTWCLLTGSSPTSRFPWRCWTVLYCTVLYCTVLYASFDAMAVGPNSQQPVLRIQLAVHRRCHRLCRHDHSKPGLLTVSSVTSTV